MTGSGPGPRAGAPPLVVIAGATATGKTSLSLRLADRLAVEGLLPAIISADSRQVFRGMDIGTAKVSPAERARVPHHGLDLVDPDAPFSLADYTAHVRTALEEIAGRGGVAILAGGTGLYLRAVARGIDTAALPSDAAVRERIETAIEHDGLTAAASRLSALAPGLAARTDPRNPRRVARALEIAELQGDLPLPPPTGYPGPVTWIGLTVEGSVLARRIAERAAGQFRGGLLDEARALLDRYPPGLRSFSAIGYPEAFAALSGTLTVEGAIDQAVRRTIAFAKRQGTWFRAEPGIAWLDAAGTDPLPAAWEQVAHLLEQRAGASEA
jgi:tRNA dimethylallyltransferase